MFYGCRKYYVIDRQSLAECEGSGEKVAFDSTEPHHHPPCHAQSQGENAVVIWSTKNRSVSIK